MLKYLVVSTRCLDRATDPVMKLKTDPAPFACSFENLSHLFSFGTLVKLFLVPERNGDGDQDDLVDQHSTLSSLLDE